MNKLKNKKYLFTILAIFLVAGFTFAYFQTSASFVNIFNTGTYRVVTTEEFVGPENWAPGQEIPKTITSTNEGTIPAAVRVSYTEQWLKEIEGVETDITSQVSSGTVIINLDNTSEWIQEGNYYYYKYILDPTKTTSSFIKSVTLNPNMNGASCTQSQDGLTQTCEASNPALGATYKLTITKETVQADKYQEVWNTNVEITENKPTAIQMLKSKATPVTNEKEPVAISHNQTEQVAATTDYRYMGEDPNNYLLFNCSVDNPEEQNDETCEVWKIYGIIDGKIKIIDLNPYTDSIWPPTGNYVWENSTLFSHLNDDYYNSLSSISKNVISESTWYLGGWQRGWKGETVEGVTYKQYDYLNDAEDYTEPTNESSEYGLFPEGIYIAERSYLTYNNRPSSVNAKVGIENVSDYLFTSSACYSTCIATSSTCGMHLGNYLFSGYGWGQYAYNGVVGSSRYYGDFDGDTTCEESSWLGDYNIETLNVAGDDSIQFSTPNGRYWGNNVYNVDYYPTMYLNTNVVFTGTGTSSDPYKIA